jgi:trimeric autotransporter adhesin
MKSNLTVLFRHAGLLVGFVFVAFNATSAFGQLPNLVPQGITLGASSVVAGGTLAVNWTLANNGAGSSPATVTGVRINQFSSSGSATPYTSFADVAMRALPANSWTAQSTTITIPAGTAPGTYYVWIIADNATTNQPITQTSYADDQQHSVAFTVTAAPNLVPQGITLGTSSVVAGGTLAVNWTLANTGAGSSPATVTGVRFNQSTSSSTAASTTNVVMPALAANSSTAQSTTIAIPAGTAPGTYYVWVIADNVTNGAIIQTSNADDQQHSVPFTVTAAPNLVPQGITLGASSVVAGGTLAVNWTLANTGSGSSPATVTGVRFNQSTSSSAAASTTNVVMPVLAANSSTAQSTTIAIPAGTAPGTYYVWIIADNVTNGPITQTSYTDDQQHSVAFTVTAAPNLVPQGITLGASSVVAGSTLAVNWTLANTGAGNSPATVTGVRFNQSTSSSTAASTTNVVMPALAANSSTKQSAIITIPAGTAPGTYYVWVIADNVTNGPIIQTSYTDDQQHSVAFTVTAAPNLVPQRITLGASSVVAGGTLAVNWTLANTGAGGSPATVTGVRINQSSSSGNATPYTSFADVAMPALAANSSTAQSTTIAIPAGTATGTYYVWIIADNVTNGPITQTSYADDYARSTAFTITGAASRPTITNPKLKGTTFTISVGTQIGFNYVLEFKNSLSDANWISGQTVSGTGGAVILTDSGAVGSSRVYRVRVQ